MSNIWIQLEVQKFLNFKQDNVCMINASVIVGLHIRPQMEWITNAFIIEDSSKQMSITIMNQITQREENSLHHLLVLHSKLLFHQVMCQTSLSNLVHGYIMLQEIVFIIMIENAQCWHSLPLDWHYPIPWQKVMWPGLLGQCE
jgi:hypothetical protein